MAHLSKEFCKKIADTRRERGITQSALAKSAGCAQSALSMFESGHPQKLSMVFVEKIAEILQIPIEERRRKDATELLIGSSTKKGYCPNTACLSNIPYIINDELFIRPELTELSDTVKYCATCGEVLERCCPKCGGSVTNGACCRVCGQPRVITALPPGIAQDKWVAKRRDEIRQWQSFNF
jgi:transcriptional regulator with XRE-family HTH domain